VAWSAAADNKNPCVSERKGHYSSSARAETYPAMDRSIQAPQIQRPICMFHTLIFVFYSPILPLWTCLQPLYSDPMTNLRTCIGWWSVPHVDFQP